MIKKKKNLCLDEIVSIEDVGIVDTYDFVIPDTHCFIANDILIHNSGVLEENVDAVIIVHWYWKYHAKKADGTDYSKNDYALYVAKNRNGRTGKCDIFFVPEYYLFKDGYNG